MVAGVKMASDEEKIAALKAIRDKARASRLETGEDGTFAVYDEEEDESLRRAYPEYAAGGSIRTEEEEPAEDDNDVSSREEAFAADEYLPEDDDEYDERERYEDPAGSAPGAGCRPKNQNVQGNKGRRFLNVPA